jgi:surface carbohydrate biosynthesis protein
VKIGIVLDNPKRDLRGVVLVAYELLKRRAEVYIMPMYQHGYDVPLVAPDAVLVNYARPNNRTLLQMFHDLGIRVMVSDTEGGVLSESGADAPLNWARKFGELNFGRFVDHYFFWGTRLRDAFASAEVLPPRALEVTGCPRYDLCHSRWHAVLSYPTHGFVLVNTNFSALNPKFGGSAAAEIEVFERMGWDLDYARNLFRELQAVFPQYLDAIEGIARRNPQRHFVVRPHPFENAALYVDRFAPLSNVSVDPSGDVLNPISGADCVVHLNCGTAVEALLLGKTPISLEYLNTDALRSHAPVPAAISCPASGPNDLDFLINNPGTRSERWNGSGLLSSYVEPWFYRIDGRASERIACGIIREVSRGEIRVRRSVASSMRGAAGRPGMGRLMQGIACNVVGSRAAGRLRSLLNATRREKDVVAKDVTDLLQKYAQCDASPVRVRVMAARHPVSGVALASLHLSAEIAA